MGWNAIDYVVFNIKISRLMLWKYVGSQYTWLENPEKTNY